MQIEHLRYFIILSQYQSINKTSKALSTTPQNISRILKNLEREMDTNLFVRSTDGITLTSTGLSFLEFAKTTVYQYDKLQSDIQFHKSVQKQKTQITMYSSPVINEMLLTDILLAFSQAYPDIIVNNILTDWQVGYKKIQENPSAIAFLGQLARQNTPDGYDCIAVGKPQAIAVVAKHHAYSCLPVITLQQLLQEKIILLTQNHFQQTEFFHVLNQTENSPSTLQISVSGSLKYCYQLAATGEYVCPGVLESFTRQSTAVTKNLAAVPIVDFPDITITLIKSKKLSSSSAQYLLFTFIQEYIQNKLSAS